METIFFGAVINMRLGIQSSEQQDICPAPSCSTSQAFFDQQKRELRGRSSHPNYRYCVEQLFSIREKLVQLNADDIAGGL